MSEYAKIKSISVEFQNPRHYTSDAVHQKFSATGGGGEKVMVDYSNNDHMVSMMNLQSGSKLTLNHAKLQNERSISECNGSDSCVLTFTPSWKGAIEIAAESNIWF